MLDYNTDAVETGLMELVNNILDDVDVYLKPSGYYKMNLSLWEERQLQHMIKTFKFKIVGHASEFPEVLPQSNVINESEAYLDVDKVDVIFVSEKYNSVMIYTEHRYCVKVFLLIDSDKYRKFNKKLVPILDTSKGSGIFNNVDFKCKKKQYIEISSPVNDEDKYVSIEKKKVGDETLVFDTGSEIFNVMGDIKEFFTENTRSLYKKMNIPYKRGAIIYGAAGNGKTAMLREIIRHLKGVSVIIINPNTPRVSFILSELIRALNGRPSLIIIEDIDSVVGNSNRSEFLNVLDGINVKSGIYFIGTTNYPERLDPAIIHRSGRFGRSYEVPNPGETVRKAFFRSCKIDSILKGFKLYKDQSANTGKTIIDLFTQYSDGLSMTNLKELMISTQHTLVNNKSMSIEEALETNHNLLTAAKQKHEDAHNRYEERMNRRFSSRDYYE